MNFILETLSECGEAYVWLIICAIAYVIGICKSSAATNCSVHYKNGRIR